MSVAVCSDSPTNKGHNVAINQITRSVEGVRHKAEAGRATATAPTQGREHAVGGSV